MSVFVQHRHDKQACAPNDKCHSRRPTAGFRWSLPKIPAGIKGGDATEGHKMTSSGAFIIWCAGLLIAVVLLSASDDDYMRHNATVENTGQSLFSKTQMGY